MELKIGKLYQLGIDFEYINSKDQYCVRAVSDIYSRLPGVPIVGVGGVTNGLEALEMMMAGSVFGRNAVARLVGMTKDTTPLSNRGKNALESSSTLVLDSRNVGSEPVGVMLGSSGRYGLLTKGS